MSRLRIQLHRRPRRLRNGAIFVLALGIIVILSGLAIVLAQSMRTEGLAAGNRVSYAQADAVEKGAEQWVLAQIEANINTNQNGDAMTITQIPAEALQVNKGYFWLIRPDPDSDQQYQYGIQDESGKLNLNYPPPALATTTDNEAQMLLSLPGMTEDVADAIVDWHHDGTSPTQDGAESSFYNGRMEEPYDAKNAPFETVEELLLVRNMTPEILFGYDLNRDGVIDDAERTAGGSSSTFNSGGASDSRGIFNYLTVYTQNSTVLQPARGGGGGGRGGGGGGAAAATTTTPAGAGLININTASEAVLECLGLQQSDADAIISYREQNDGGFTSAQELAGLITGQAPATLGSMVTITSYQYSADIVAVSADGRAFKRVRIVVDCSPPTTTGIGTSAASASTSSTQLAKIVYRRDLTSYGWPLPAEIRTELKNGQQLQPGTTNSGSNMSSGSLGLGH